MMNEIRKMLEQKHKEDMIIIERQMRTFEALTEKRLHMVRVIREQKPTSIRALALFLNRDVKNVFDDIRLLNKMHIVQLIRTGQSMRPVIKKKIIVISLE